MISIYIKLALRYLAKYRLYALINILGLALGLTIFLFGSMVIDYEKDHDNMFSERDRTFIVGSIFAPAAGTGILEYPNVKTTYGPLFDLEIEEAEVVARSIYRAPIVTVDNSHYYQGIRFVEAGFTDIFDFRYLHGDSTAVNNPRGLIVTVSTAKKLFGHADVLGEVVSLNHKYDMHIAAVIEDVALDSHFNTSFLPDNDLAAIASLQALVALEGFDMAGSWKGLSPYNMTYILLPENRDRQWLQNQVDAVAERHAPEDEHELISALKVRPLVEVNTQIWDAFGFPVLESIQLLGLLILVVACLNYTNLATAQSFGRSREVGLRKTLGATRLQLLSQFLIESLSLAAFAMLLALAGIELLVPAFNGWAGKGLALDYLGILPGLVLVTLLVGLLAGAYPAFLISRLNPIEGLRNVVMKGRRGNRFRAFMIAAQFAISIFMLAMVMIIYFQNEKIKEISSTFLKAQTVILKRINTEGVVPKHDTLQRELSRIDGVQAVTFSNDVPYNSGGLSAEVTPVSGDETLSFDTKIISVDTDFMAAYDIELLAGRPFDETVANDLYREEVGRVNVIVNRLAAKKLGFDEGREVIGKSFYKLANDEDGQTFEYTVIGLVPDHYFDGAHSAIAPMTFLMQPDSYSFASLRVSGHDLNQTLSDIDAVWDQVVGDYPIQRTFLDFYFNLFFRFPEGINNVLAAFAGVALSLALIGLFGLAAFMAQRRTREIGIRKVMGASVSQIVRLLIWQFSLPVIWSLLVATPLAYLASSIYLDFFPERIDFTLPVILLASALGVLTAWAIVAGHAINIARTTPARSLRYE
ncbi:FtsX-like permease family protein [Exilibacterium tricleocarpae]|uniref:FtsX-like permease family protein n=1 Tax=Exilibacterium tricleocarpae TaxID=2591008 RepID=A0A545T5U7_9GAMM|nr:ABC transporter permease [Exilibacterium tricleocarpae]TQV72589.1 FtsX-like permease family protein [Exilibacterium tricleocarpae]